jgi:hypothetical protein
MSKRLFAALALAAALTLGVAGSALANPGPGSSFQCAKGVAVDHCPPNK